MDQLTLEERLAATVIVRKQFMVQQLVVVEKSRAGEISLRQILPVRFVPLTGDHD